jgi:hypothetical protein
MLRKLLTAVAVAAALSSTNASAAVFKAYRGCEDGKDQNCHIVVVVGRIELGDEEKFKQELEFNNVTKALVALHSDGGNLVSGLAIGREIKRRGFNTSAGNLCASVCGAIWLAGARRYVMPTSKVGFHGAFVMDGKRAVNTNGGNAIVGAYYRDMGLTDKAIFYLTSATPKNMLWLHSDSAKTLGIEFLMIAPSSPSSQAKRSDCAVVLKATDGYWNVRAAPNGAILQKVFRGDTVDIVQVMGAWTQVTLHVNMNVTGWISNDGIQQIPCAQI